MRQEIINSKTKRLLESLVKIKEIKDFYLAGGTALALQIRHRQSIDLDWFSQKQVSIIQLKRSLSSLGNLTVESEDKETLNCSLNGVKLSFFVYPYLLLFSLIDFSGVKIADERDIACMKIDAISSRGSKKDFIDLYFLLRKYQLRDLLDLFDKKYKNIKYNRLHILKSLVYFEEAENEPMPKMFQKITWLAIKNKVRKEIKEII